MNNCQNQPQEECSNYLPPIESISVGGEFEGMSFKLTVNAIIRQVISSVSACTNNSYECNNEA